MTKKYLDSKGEKYVYSKVPRASFGTDLLKGQPQPPFLRGARERKKIVWNLSKKEYGRMKREIEESPFVHIFVTPAELREIADEAESRLSGKDGRKLGMCYTHLDERTSFAIYAKPLLRTRKKKKK